MGYLFFGLIAFVFIMILMIADSKNKAEQKAKDVQSMSLKIDKDNGFKTFKKIVSRNSTFILSFNEEDKKLLISKKDAIDTINYEDIIGVELIQDNIITSSKSTSNIVGRAIVGGVLLGGVGALIGGVTGKDKQKESASYIGLNIHTKNITIELCVFDSLNEFASKKIKKGQLLWSEYETGRKQAKEIERLLTVIVDKNTPVKTPQLSTADDLSKLGTLLKDGLLTQEEFEQEKAKMLNRGSTQASHHFKCR